MNERLIDRRSALGTVGVVLLVALVAPFAVYAVPQLAGASQSYVVLSSSMSPTIHAGDVVVVEDVRPEQVAAGDVITFRPPTGHEQSDVGRVTHRVVDVVERDGGRYFRTKGDANEEPDSELVPGENVIGRNVLTIPLIGRVIAFGRTGAGIALFLIVPSVLLLANELYGLKRAYDGHTSEERKL